MLYFTFVYLVLCYYIVIVIHASRMEAIDRWHKLHLRVPSTASTPAAPAVAADRCSGPATLRREDSKRAVLYWAVPGSVRARQRVLGIAARELANAPRRNTLQAASVPTKRTPAFILIWGNLRTISENKKVGWPWYLVVAVVAGRRFLLGRGFEKVTKTFHCGLPGDDLKELLEFKAEEGWGASAPREHSFGCGPCLSLETIPPHSSTR